MADCKHPRCRSHPLRCEYATRIIDPAIRFWSKVSKDGPVPLHRPELGPCWLWVARCLPSGYGSFWVGTATGKTTAQRFSYEFSYGTNPGNLDVCHHCDNPSCVRPDHLFLGTASENALDMVAKGRHSAAVHPESIPRGERTRHARLTAIQVLEIRSRHAAGESVKQIATDYPVKDAAISHIVTRRNWRHI